MNVNESGILGDSNKCVVISVGWASQTLQHRLLQAISTIEQIYCFFNIFAHLLGISICLFIKNEIYNFLFFSLCFRVIICVLDKNEPYNFFPIVIQDFFSDLMCTYTVRSKPLHSKIVYKPILLNILNVLSKIFVRYVPINKSQSHCKSISLQHPKVNSRPNSLKWTNLYFWVPIALFHSSNKHFRISSIYSHSLSSNASLVLISAYSKLSWHLLCPLSNIMYSLHRLNIRLLQRNTQILGHLSPRVTSPFCNIVFLSLFLANGLRKEYSYCSNIISDT